MTLANKEQQQQMINVEDGQGLTDNPDELAAQLGQLLLDSNWRITTAESCTGGLIAGAITQISGSSSWFEEGIVTYSNEAKQRLLGVAPSVFEIDGAVSEACVRAMASGALRASGADMAISVSGVAGPGGGSAEKPVGTVWLAWAYAGTVEAEHFEFSGGRQEVRMQAVVRALHGSIHRLDRIRQHQQ
jgi:nicotinamide-nucleotide amidase